MFRKEKPELLEPLGLTTAAGPALSTSQPIEQTNQPFIDQEQAAFAAIEKRWEKYQATFNTEVRRATTGPLFDLREAMMRQRSEVAIMRPEVTDKNAQKLQRVKNSRIALQALLEKFDMRIAAMTRLTEDVRGENRRCRKIISDLKKVQKRFEKRKIDVPPAISEITNKATDIRDDNVALNAGISVVYLHGFDADIAEKEGRHQALKTRLNALTENMSHIQKEPTFQPKKPQVDTSEPLEVTQDTTENPSRLKGLQERLKKFNPARLFKKEIDESESPSDSQRKAASTRPNEDQEETATPSDVQNGSGSHVGRNVPSLTAFVAQPKPKAVRSTTTQPSSSAEPKSKDSIAGTLTSLQNAFGNLQRSDPTIPVGGARFSDDESSESLSDRSPTSSDTEHLANNISDSKQKKRFPSSFLFFSKKPVSNESLLDSESSQNPVNASDVSHILDSFDVFEWENKNPGMFGKTAAAAFNDLYKATSAAIEEVKNPKPDDEPKKAKKSVSGNKTLSERQKEAARKKIAAEKARARNLEMHKGIELVKSDKNPNKLIIKKQLDSGVGTDTSIEIVHIEKHVKQKGAKGDAAPTEAGLSIRAASPEPHQDACELMLDKMRDAKRKDPDKAVFISGCEDNLLFALRLYVGCIERGLNPQLSPKEESLLSPKEGASQDAQVPDIQQLQAIYRELKGAKESYTTAVAAVKQAKSKGKRAFREETKRTTGEAVETASNEKNRIKALLLEKKEALKVIESSKNNDTSSSARPGF